MNKKTLWIVGVIGIVILIGVFSFNKNQSDDETIKIGVILPLSGSGAVYGEWGTNALEIAKDEINNDGGINGNRIELIYEDGQFSTSETVSAFHKLINNDNVKYVMTIGSSPAVSVSPLANENEVIQMDFSATTSEYRSEGDFTFRTALQAEQFGRDAARWLIDKNEQEASMLYINNDQGVSIYNAFKEEYGNLGGNLLRAEKFSQDGVDFRTEILKAIVNDNHYIFLIGHLKESGIIVRQINELGHKNPVLSHVFSVEGDTFLEGAGNFENEIVYLAPDYQPDKNELTKRYNNEYVNKYGENSEYFGAFGYDALKVLVLAISNCNNVYDTECVKNELFDVEGYNGLTGDITFDEYGDREADLTLKKIENNQFIFVQ